MKMRIVFILILTLTLLGMLAWTWPVATPSEETAFAASQDEASSRPTSLDVTAQAAVTQAVVVDVYQSMDSDLPNGALLTPAIMETSTHGGLGGVTATWTINGNMWVSTDYVRSLPGPVIVNGKEYDGSSARTWKFNDKYQRNFVNVLFGNLPRVDPYQPDYDYMTVACYYTPGPDYVFSQNYDTIIMDGEYTQTTPIYAVFQTIGDLKQPGTPNDPPYFRAHVEKYPQVSPSIKVEAGKTYWINLHHNGPDGIAKVAVFDPDNKWAKVGEVEINQGITNVHASSRVCFGRCDAHGDSTSAKETYSYFSHIIIDYTNVATEVVFPLLPYIPKLELQGRSGNKTIYLDWTTNITLPVTTTWDIDYYTTTTTAPFTVTGLISTTNSFTLMDHIQNYQWYTVTLYAMPGKWLSDTVRVMPTGRFVYLPLILK